GGLGIEHHEGTRQRHAGPAVDRGHHIVHKVRFAAVDQLEVGVFLVDVVGGQHGLGVALADAVVGDGDGPVAHAVGQAHDLAGVVEAVHGTGLGVQVQFHPLLPYGGGI